jgi:hypothetical protein
MQQIELDVSPSFYQLLFALFVGPGLIFAAADYGRINLYKCFSDIFGKGQVCGPIL